MPDINLAPLITPHGRLLLAPLPEAPALADALRLRLAQAFDRGAGYGLLQLGAGEAGVALPPVFAYWREFAGGYMAALCALPEAENGTLARIEAPACALRPASRRNVQNAPSPRDHDSYRLKIINKNNKLVFFSGNRVGDFQAF